MSMPLFQLIQLLLQYNPFHRDHVYYPKTSSCASFLSNYDTKSIVSVLFNNRHYNLSPWFVSILPDCTNVSFNIAMVLYFEFGEEKGYILEHNLLREKMVFVIKCK